VHPGSGTILVLQQHSSNGGAEFDEQRAGLDHLALGLFCRPQDPQTCPYLPVNDLGLALDDSWPPDTQRRFTEELRRTLEPQPTVHLTRYKCVTMAPVPGDRSQ
jgi:hypothetical protein